MNVFMTCTQDAVNGSFPTLSLSLSVMESTWTHTIDLDSGLHRLQRRHRRHRRLHRRHLRLLQRHSQPPVVGQGEYEEDGSVSFD